MTIKICDVCLSQLPRGLPSTIFWVAGRTFDVCSICEDLPFRIPPPIHATVNIRNATTPAVEVFVSR